VLFINSVVRLRFRRNKRLEKPRRTSSGICLADGQNQAFLFGVPPSGGFEIFRLKPVHQTQLNLPREIARPLNRYKLGG
jgi:hypothetical protein